MILWDLNKATLWTASEWWRACIHPEDQEKVDLSGTTSVQPMTKTALADLLSGRSKTAVSVVHSKIRAYGLRTVDIRI